MADKPIDLNTADEKTLAQINGIGPKRARMIVEFRRQHGGRLNSYDDLRQMQGFSDRFVQILQENTRLG